MSSMQMIQPRPRSAFASAVRLQNQWLYKCSRMCQRKPSTMSCFNYAHAHDNQTLIIWHMLKDIFSLDAVPVMMMAQCSLNADYLYHVQCRKKALISSANSETLLNLRTRTVYSGFYPFAMYSIVSGKPA